MKNIKAPKYTHAFIDRSGTRRYYLRLPGRKRVPLPGEPWTPEFMAAREQAMKADWITPQLGASRTRAGTVNAALVSYYQSTGFSSLAIGTRRSRRAVLENFREEYGDRPIGTLPKKALQVIIDKKSPASQRNFKKAMRGLIDHAMSLDIVTVDPLIGLKLTAMKTEGHHPWTAEECAQFEAFHALGTRARLAYELLFQVGQSRCDVVRMGRQHVRKGILALSRQKTDVQFDVRVMPSLQAAIDAMPPSDHLSFLVTGHGKQFSAAGFGNWFREVCNAAGLPARCTSHGLRKAAATRLADRGATTTQLMAWFGWKSASEAERYTRNADRKLASESAGRLISGTVIGKP